MKIIDILNKMAEGTLEDGFKFKYKNDVYTYSEKYDEISEKEYNSQFGENNITEQTLNDEVEVIEDVKEIEEIKTKKDKDNNTRLVNDDDEISIFNSDKIIIDKINELVRAVNQLRKDKNE